MNEVLERIAAHHSVRRFAPEAVPDERVRAVVEAAQMAATSSWIQAYCLIQIRDRPTRAALRELCGGQAQVQEAGAFFVVCADVRRHQLVARAAGAPYIANLETFLLAVVDATLFAQNLTLGFESLGYGTCYIGGLRNRVAEVDRLLELPEGVMPLFGLCAGVPAEGDDAVRRPRLPVEAVWMQERYVSDDRMRELLARYDLAAEEHYGARGLAGRNWTGGIWRKFRVPLRDHLRRYYESKGARFA